MKKTHFFLIILILSINTLFSNSAKLDSVKLFLDGAEMFHSVEVELVAGSNEVVIENVANLIIPNSLRVSTYGDCELETFTIERDFINNEEINFLKDSIKKYGKEISYLQADRFSLESQMNLILASSQVGSNTKLTNSDINTLSTLYKNELPKIRKGIIDIDIEIEELTKKQNKFKLQLNEKNLEKSYKNKIKLLLNSSDQTKTLLTFSYLNSGASWTPKYDFKFNSEGRSSIVNKALIINRSDLDWKNLPLVFSSRNFMDKDQIPEILKNTLVLKDPRIRGLSQNNYFNEEVRLEEAVVVNSVGVASSGSGFSIRGSRPNKIRDSIDIRSRKLSANFELDPKIKFTIENESKPRTFNLVEREVEAEFEYLCIPAIDKSVHLTARIPNTSDYNLIPSSINIYLDNSFIGTNYLNTDVTNSELSISLGKDKGLISERVSLKDFEEDQFFSTKVKRSFGIQLKIKNTKNKKIKLVLKDQIPISGDSDIEISFDNQEELEIEPNEDGILKWEIELEPGEFFSKDILYSVTWPKDENVYPPLGFQKRKK